MAKNAFRGLVVSFRRAKYVQHLNQTIVEVGPDPDPATLVGAKVIWSAEGGPRFFGRVVARHGRGNRVRVRWRKGFPPQGIGTSVEIVPA